MFTFLPFVLPLMAEILHELGAGFFGPSTVAPLIPAKFLWNQATAPHKIFAKYSTIWCKRVLLLQEFPNYWHIAVSSSVACYVIATTPSTPPSTDTGGLRNIIWVGVGWSRWRGRQHASYIYVYVYHIYIYIFIYLNDIYIYIYIILILVYLFNYAPNVEWHPPKVSYPHMTRDHIWYRWYNPYIFQYLIRVFFWNDEIKGAFWSISLTFALRCLTTWSPTLKVSRPHQVSPGLTENHRLVGKPSIRKVCLTASWWIVLLHQDSVWHSNYCEGFLQEPFCSMCFCFTKFIVCYCCSLGLAWMAGGGPCWDVLRWIMHFDIENIHIEIGKPSTMCPYTKHPYNIFRPCSSLNYKALEGWRFPSKVDWSPWTRPQAGGEWWRVPVR